METPSNPGENQNPVYFQGDSKALSPINASSQTQFIRSAYSRALQSISKPPGLTGVLVFLQILWFAAIGVSGANTNWIRLVFLVFFSIMAGLLVLRLPESVVARLEDGKQWLLRKELRAILFLCAFSLFAGIIYAFFQRLWTDEGPSLAAAIIIADQGFSGIVASYAKIDWLRFQHPPLIPIINGLAMRWMGQGLVQLRLISVIFLVATIVTTYFLGRSLFGKETGFNAAMLMLSFPLVIRLGSTAMMDMQVCFFFTLALLLSTRLARKPSLGLAVLFGVVIGLGFLSKYIMVFIFGVLLGYVIFIPDYRKVWSHLAVAGMVAFLMLGAWFGFASRNGILGGQLQRAIEFSGIYHLFSDSRAEIGISENEMQSGASNYDLDIVRATIIKIGLETLFSRLPSALGVYHLPLILVGGVMLLRRRNRTDLFMLLWIGVVSFILFVTLPDHRYFMVTFPALAVMVGNYLEQRKDLAMKYLCLSVLFAVGALFLLIDWSREAHLFLPDG